jgi:phosphohistidine phosphatase
MQLLLIRHAIAEDRDEFAKTGKSDELRPLTKDGKRKMRANAKGLHRIVGSIDLLAASPLVRAVETAAIVSVAFDDIPVVTVKALEPDAEFDDFVVWLNEQEGAVIAVVGHEPHLGILVTWLLTGVAEPRVPLKKGGACLLEFEGRLGHGAATLVWSATPRLLSD